MEPVAQTGSVPQLLKDRNEDGEGLHSLEATDGSFEVPNQLEKESLAGQEPEQQDGCGIDLSQRVARTPEGRRLDQLLRAAGAAHLYAFSSDDVKMPEELLTERKLSALTPDVWVAQVICSKDITPWDGRAFPDRTPTKVAKKPANIKPQRKKATKGSGKRSQPMDSDEQEGCASGANGDQEQSIGEVDGDGDAYKDTNILSDLPFASSPPLQVPASPAHLGNPVTTAAPQAPAPPETVETDTAPADAASQDGVASSNAVPAASGVAPDTDCCPPAGSTVPAKPVKSRKPKPVVDLGTSRDDGRREDLMARLLAGRAAAAAKASSGKKGNRRAQPASAQTDRVWPRALELVVWLGGQAWGVADVVTDADVRVDELVLFAPNGVMLPSATPGGPKRMVAQDPFVLKHGFLTDGQLCSAFDAGWTNEQKNHIVVLPATCQLGPCPAEAPQGTLMIATKGRRCTCYPYPRTEHDLHKEHLTKARPQQPRDPYNINLFTTVAMEVRYDCQRRARQAMDFVEEEANKIFDQESQGLTADYCKYIAAKCSLCERYLPPETLAEWEYEAAAAAEAVQNVEVPEGAGSSDVSISQLDSSGKARDGSSGQAQADPSAAPVTVSAGMAQVGSRAASLDNSKIDTPMRRSTRQAVKRTAAEPQPAANLPIPGTVPATAATANQPPKQVIRAFRGRVAKYPNITEPKAVPNPGPASAAQPSAHLPAVPAATTAALPPLAGPSKQRCRLKPNKAASKVLGSCAGNKRKPSRSSNGVPTVDRTASKRKQITSSDSEQTPAKRAAVDGASSDAGSCSRPQRTRALPKRLQDGATASCKTPLQTNVKVQGTSRLGRLAVPLTAPAGCAPTSAMPVMSLAAAKHAILTPSVPASDKAVSGSCPSGPLPTRSHRVRAPPRRLQQQRDEEVAPGKVAVTTSRKRKAAAEPTAAHTAELDISPPAAPAAPVALGQQFARMPSHKRRMMEAVAVRA